ncbi:hypothetical protein PLICRDRAFT_178430 [Plicaturopsis crispa FD-325 SS-3]|nr:hypothetical protein PLICRDRAFT_178430 [Plicaturopsis crispa FD-325 SS-3]
MAPSPIVTQLRVEFPRNSNRSTVTLDRVVDAEEGVARRKPRTTTVATATVQSSISITNHSKVYRAMMANQAVVLKFSVPNKLDRFDKRSSLDIEDEARAYRGKLQTLQGTVVPRFFGYFKAETQLKREIGCLVLEDCGERVGGSFLALPHADRVTIFKLLAKLHERRCATDDFAERNVVCRDGEYRLIDFHDLKYHRCKSTDLHIGKPTPSVADIGCGDLFFYGKEMDIWPIARRPHVMIGGLAHNKELFPPQDVIDQLVPDDQEAVRANLHVLTPWLRNYKRVLDENGVVDISSYKKTMPDIITATPLMDFEEYQRRAAAARLSSVA